MTERQLQNRNEKSLPLKVWQVGEGQHVVESSEGKVYYKVLINSTTKYCTCKDYESNKAPDFVCKHILAVMNGNGNIQKIGMTEKPKLDDRFIMSLQGKDFVKYAGLLDLAHQLGLCKLTVEPIQYATKENGNEAICRAIAETANGEIFIDIGDANPNNTNRMIAQHLLRMASTRAKARVLRDLTNVGITALEELGEFEDDNEAPQNGGNKKPPKASKAPQNSSPPKQADERKPQAASQQAPPQTSAEKKKEDNGKPKQEAAPGGVPIFQAQQRAIQNLAQRRAMSPEELSKLLQDEYNVNGLQDLTSGQASSLIGYLQKSA